MTEINARKAMDDARLDQLLAGIAALRESGNPLFTSIKPAADELAASITDQIPDGCEEAAGRALLLAVAMSASVASQMRRRRDPEWKINRTLINLMTVAAEQVTRS